MKKIILMLFGLIIITGCSANVNLNIDDKNNVSEKVYLYEQNDIIDGVETSKEEFLNSTYNFFKSDKILKYQFWKKYNSEDFGMEFTRNTKGVCDAFKTSAFSDFFDKLECVEKRNYYEIKAESSFMKCAEDESECFSAKNVNIEIQLPESAISSNADIIEGNKYIWKYNFGDVATFNLKLKRYKTGAMDIVNVKNVNANIWIVLGVILIIILVVSGILFIKYRKNKLQY